MKPILPNASQIRIPRFSNGNKRPTDSSVTASESNRNASAKIGNERSARSKSNGNASSRSRNASGKMQHEKRADSRNKSNGNSNSNSR